MSREISLRLRNALLEAALRILAEELGYTVTDDAEVPMITDDTELRDSEKKILYVLEEDVQGLENRLVRPFTVQELSKALNQLFGDRETEQIQGLRVDVKKQTAYYADKKAELTEKETLLLALLLKNEGKTVSDEEIVEKVWKNETVQSSNIAAVYVNYLRNKLDMAFGLRNIYRVRGQGYTLKETERKS